MILPGLSVLERLIISVCSEVHERLFESLYRQLSEEIRQAIDELLIATSGDQRSLFYLLKEYPPSATITSIQSYLERYRSLDGTGIDAIESRIVDPAGLRTNQERFGDDSCSSEQYERAVEAFTENPAPPGTVMNWVCRNNWDYLDLKKYPLDLNPRP